MTYLRKITKLPRSMRVYFDDFAHEYKSISNEQKLLELANSLWLGVDLHLELKDFLANHQQVSECDVKRCLINYIGYLMTGSPLPKLVKEIWWSLQMESCTTF